MNGPRENEPSHPLEQVTGEKDVHPEEEEERQSRPPSGSPGAQDDTAAPGGEDASAGQE